MLFDRKALEDYIPKNPPEHKTALSPSDYVYCGNWMVWDCSPAQRRAFRRLCAILIPLETALFAITGSSRCLSNTSAPVAVSSLLSLIPLLAAVTGILSFSWRQERMPEYDFHLLSLRLGPGLAAHFFLLLAAFLFSLRCAFLFRPEAMLPELRVAAGYLCCSSIPFFLFLRWKKLASHLEFGA